MANGQVVIFCCNSTNGAKASARGTLCTWATYAPLRDQWPNEPHHGRNRVVAACVTLYYLLNHMLNSFPGPRPQLGTICRMRTLHKQIRTNSCCLANNLACHLPVSLGNVPSKQEGEHTLFQTPFHHSEGACDSQGHQLADIRCQIANGLLLNTSTISGKHAS